MKKLFVVLLAVALTLSLSSRAMAYVDVNWNTVKSPGALLLWPNEAGSPNIAEANIGLLGRIVVKWPGDTGVTAANQELEYDQVNGCELAPSFPCAAGEPGSFLIGAGEAEGPKGAGGGDQCNVVVTACGLSGTANAPPFNGPAYIGEDTTQGTYSYYVIHKESLTGKGIGFFSGSTTVRLDPDNSTPGSALYICNDCPVGGIGKDNDDAIGMNNSGAGMKMRTMDTNLWGTQTVSPYGHVHVFLKPNGGLNGKGSVCGNSITFQNLGNDLCVDGTSAAGNYDLVGQKTVNFVYSVNLAHHTTGAAANKGRCNAPDCYVEKVIIPAALAQDANATNVMMQAATTILPNTAPGSIKNATVDSMIFYYTTNPLDVDGDGTSDNIDPCPNDSTDTCVQDLINGGNCPAGQVFCADANGDLACVLAYQCNSRIDVDRNCIVDADDLNALTGVQNGISGFEAIGSGIPIGPFDP